jgi:hypothetical protein
MDDRARQAGYRDGESLRTIVDRSAKHHESAWRERIEGMIEFIMRK